MFYNLIESDKQFLCNFLLYNIFFGCKGTHFFNKLEPKSK